MLMAAMLCSQLALTAASACSALWSYLKHAHTSILQNLGWGKKVCVHQDDCVPGCHLPSLQKRVRGGMRGVIRMAEENESLRNVFDKYMGMKLDEMRKVTSPATAYWVSRDSSVKLHIKKLQMRCHMEHDCMGKVSLIAGTSYVMGSLQAWLMPAAARCTPSVLAQSPCRSLQL